MDGTEHKTSQKWHALLKKHSKPNKTTLQRIYSEPNSMFPAKTKLCIVTMNMRHYIFRYLLPVSRHKYLISG
jgi:hypothetical protein